MRALRIASINGQPLNTVKGLPPGMIAKVETPYAQPDPAGVSYLRVFGTPNGPIPDRIAFPIDDGSDVQTMLRFKLKPGGPPLALKTGDLRLDANPAKLDRLN